MKLINSLAEVEFVIQGLLEGNIKEISVGYDVLKKFKNQFLIVPNGHASRTVP